MDRQARDYLRQLLIPVVDQAADELPTIVTEIAERTCAKANTPALLGFGRWRNRRRRPDPSPGAIQAAVLVNTVSSPAAAVALSERLPGSPYPWDNDARAAAHRTDLAAHATAVAAHQTPPALLILHGANDEYATPDNARNLYHALSHAYLESGQKDLIELRFFDDVAHHLTGANKHVEGLSPATSLNEAASTWLNTHLNKQDIDQAADCGGANSGRHAGAISS